MSAPVPEYPAEEPRGPRAEDVNGLDLLEGTEAEEDRPRRGPARWIILAAALLVIVLAIVGIVSLNQRGGSDVATGAAQSVAGDVADATDVKTVEAKPKDGPGKVLLRYSASEDAFAVALEGLPEPAKGGNYQISVTTPEDDFRPVGHISRVDGKWYGFRGLDGVTSVHVTEISQQEDDDDPSNPDVVNVQLPERR